MPKKMPMTFKYQIPFILGPIIYWEVEKQNMQLVSFGIRYNGNLKYFYGNPKDLLTLKQVIGFRIFFGNICSFYEAKTLIGSGGSSKVCLI
jgi:hypothetical protein